MKRQNLYDLIIAHYDKNEVLFLKTTKEILSDLFVQGEKQLAKEINKIIRSRSTVVLSATNESQNDFVLSSQQMKNIKIIKQGFASRILNKVFFYGRPGTGKTVFASLIAKKLDIPFINIRLSQIIDSKLGESMKLLDKVFHHVDNAVIFIDEIDSIASKRGVRNDLFEISRVLNHLLQLVDTLDKNKFLIVATNMQENIDHAFLRRFDISINFNKYNLEDITNIFDAYANKYNLYKHQEFYKNLRQLIISSFVIWTPSYIKKIIQVSILWLNEEQFPKEQIKEIFQQLSLGKETKEIMQSLSHLKVSQRIIKYFLNK